MYIIALQEKEEIEPNVFTLFSSSWLRVGLGISRASTVKFYAAVHLHTPRHCVHFLFVQTRAHTLQIIQRAPRNATRTPNNFTTLKEHMRERLTSRSLQRPEAVKSYTRAITLCVGL